MTGSEPLKNERKERFCNLVAQGGLTQVEAYCQSVSPTLEMTHSRVVSASRMARDDAVRDRISYLKKEIADKRARNAQPVTRESIHQLLEEVTAALMDASKAASRAGADGIAQQLHKNIVVHAGRSSRASARAPAKPKIGTDFDAGEALSRLKMCTCHD